MRNFLLSTNNNQSLLLRQVNIFKRSFINLKECAYSYKLGEFENTHIGTELTYFCVYNKKERCYFINIILRNNEEGAHALVTNK
jgi:hypothetical protein